MTPKKTKLVNSKGIRAGLGLDELTIDWETIIPGDAKMVALAGDNGCGKSTILNLGMTPHRVPPMIEGSIYDQFHDGGSIRATGASCRVLEWSHNGQDYKSEFLYSIKKTNTAKSYLPVLADGEWTPYKTAENIISDGKSSTYDACLEDILGPQSIYFLSAFRAQGAPGFEQHDDPQGLLMDLLDLTPVQELADKAGKVRVALGRAHAGLQGVVDEVESAEARIKSLREDELAARSEAQAHTDACAKQEEMVAKAQAVLAKAMEKEADKDAIEAQRKAVMDRLNEASAQRARALAEIEGRRKEIKKREDGASQRYNNESIFLEKQKIECTSRINAANAVIAKKDSIEAAIDELPGLEAKLAEQEKQVEWITRRREEMQAAMLHKTKIQGTLDRVVSEGKQAARLLDDHKKRAEYVSQVTCRGEGKYAECVALVDAIRAKEMVPHYEKTRQEKLTEFQEARKAAEEALVVCSEYWDVDQQAREILAAYSDAQEGVKQAMLLSVKGPALKQAQASLEKDRAAMAELVAKLEAVRKWCDGELRQCSVDKATIETRREEIHAEHNRKAKELGAELNKLDPGSYSADEERLALHSAKSDLEQMVEQRIDALNRASAAQAHAKNLSADIARNKETCEQARELGKVIESWHLLQKGIAGVIALSIEDALPEVSRTANQLLKDSFGPRLAIRFETQKLTNKGKVNQGAKEVLIPMVYDADTDSDAPLASKSGGQRVWLNKAISESVALFHQDAAGVQFETLFSDEADDGLTAERKQAMYVLDRAALDIGEYGRKYFVSHSPEAQALADAVVNVEGLG